MAYGFNDDRSKAQIYTQTEVDQRNAAQDSALALQKTRIDTLISEGAPGVEGRDELWTGTATSGRITLSSAASNYDCLEIHYTAGSDRRKIDRVPTNGGFLDGAVSYYDSSADIDMYIASTYVSVSGTTATIFGNSYSQANGSSSGVDTMQGNTGEITVTAIYGIKYASASEVTDIRVGYDGTVYQNAGEAVRQQYEHALTQSSEKVIIDGWRYDSIHPYGDGYSRYISHPVFLPKGSVIECSNSSQAWFPVHWQNFITARTCYSEYRANTGYYTDDSATVKWMNGTYVTQIDSYFSVVARYSNDAGELNPDNLIGIFKASRPFDIDAEMRRECYFITGERMKRTRIEEVHGGSLFMTKPRFFLRGRYCIGDLNSDQKFDSACTNITFDQVSPSGLRDTAELVGNGAIYFDAFANEIFSQQFDVNANDPRWNAFQEDDGFQASLGFADGVFPIAVYSYGHLVGGLLYEFGDYEVFQETISGYEQLEPSGWQGIEGYEVGADGFRWYESKPIFAPEGTIVKCLDTTLSWKAFVFKLNSRVRDLYCNNQITSADVDLGWGIKNEVVIPINSFLMVCVGDSENAIDPTILENAFYVYRNNDAVHTPLRTPIFMPASSSILTRPMCWEMDSQGLYITPPYGFLRCGCWNKSFQNATNFGLVCDLEFNQTSPDGTRNDCFVMSGNSILYYNAITNRIEYTTTSGSTSFNNWWSGNLNDSQKNDFIYPLVIAGTGRMQAGLAYDWYTKNMMYSKINDVEENILSENIPSYWKSHLASKIAQINDEIAESSINSDSFVFITDVHYNSNAKNSPKLIREIYKSTPVYKCFFGGDIGAQFGSVAQALQVNQDFANDMHDTNMLPTIGNHDYNTNSNSTYPLSLNQVYNSLYKEVEKVINTNRKTYYYVDNASQKIRYFVLCTEETRIAQVTSDQIDWFKQKALELNSDWTIVVFAHRYWNGGYASDTTDEDIINGSTHVDTRGASIKSAIDYVVDNGNAAIAAFVVGHVHRDLSLITSKGYPIITTSCDSYAGSAQWDPDMPNRATGDTSEQLFDVFIIDTEARTIKSLRIGPGLDRNWTY